MLLQLVVGILFASHVHSSNLPPSREKTRNHDGTITVKWNRKLLQNTTANPTMSPTFSPTTTTAQPTSNPTNSPSTPPTSYPTVYPTTTTLSPTVTNIQKTVLTIAPFDNNEPADYKCTGQNDDEIIQTAICELKGMTIGTNCGKGSSNPDAISDSIKQKGGKVKLLKGNFWVNQNIRLYSNMILEGAGMDLTIINLQTVHDEFPNSGIIRAAYTTNTLFQDFTINGNKQSEIYDANDLNIRYSYGFYTLTSEKVWVRRVKAINCPGYGFDPHGVPGQTDSTDYMIVEDCWAENNNLDGITIDKSHNVIVKNNFAINNRRNGIELTTGTTSTIVEGNHIKHSGFNYFNVGDNKFTTACGIKIQDQLNKGQRWGTKMSIINNNYIFNASDSGICIVEAKEMVVSNNIIEEAEHCIRFRDTQDSQVGVDDSIVANNLCKNNNRGILIEDSHRNIVQGNRVYSNNPDVAGIEVKRSANNVFRSNNLYGTKGYEVNTDSRDFNDIEETLTNIKQRPPTSAPTSPGQTMSPTKSPTPRPTMDLTTLNPRNFVIIENENIALKSDDDRIIDTWKGENNDFVSTDISSMIDTTTKKLYTGVTLKIKIFLEDQIDLKYYPTRFEYTCCNINNDNGIIFTLQPDGGSWKVGDNYVTHVVTDNDYYSSSQTLWDNMNRLQLYWTNTAAWQIPSEESPKVKIVYVKVGDPSSF
jgi:parallel beta-helix repeat protein